MLSDYLQEISGLADRVDNEIDVTIRKVKGKQTTEC